MSRVKDELKADIAQRFGADAAAVIDYLFEQGTLDDALARRHVVRVRFGRDYITTDRSARDVMGDIGEDLGLSRIHVLRIVHGT